LHDDIRQWKKISIVKTYLDKKEREREEGGESGEVE